VRQFINIIKAADLSEIPILLIRWAFQGPYYLLKGVGYDMYYYIKLLKDYKKEYDKDEKEIIKN
jgi:hypothetical protein